MTSDPLEAVGEQMTARWRRRREAAAAQPAGAAIGAGRSLRLMMVREVVAEDVEFGPHLLVGGVRFVGLPPVAQQTGQRLVRCYPMPNAAVTTYAVGEVVKVFHAAGVNLAEKMV